MADLVRGHDWSSTVLGVIEAWPDDLLWSVNMMLSCQIPCVVFWGAEMIQFYNDGYRPLMTSKHPSALGQPAEECWNEAWHIIGPQLTATYERGETTYKKEVLVPVYRDGCLRDIYWTYSYSPIYAATGRVNGVLIVCQDVTEEVVATRRLRESQEQLSQVLESTTDAIVAVDRNWAMTYLNPKARELYAPNRQVLGRTVWEAFPEAVYEGSPYQYHYHRAMDEGVRGAFEAHYPEPLNLWLHVEVYPTKDGIVTFSRDVSEQKRIAAALLQNEKIAATARLASSIAHEINNPLESVMNLIYLSRSAAISSEVREYLDTADREIRRISATTNQTLRFYKQSTKPKLISCADLIEEVFEPFYGQIVNAAIQVERRDRCRQRILCFDREIVQVLSNLIANAVQALPPKGGRLLVRSREGTRWPDGPRGVVVTVADTGIGISPQVKNKIFEAFFTTKDIGGTGLGLWVSQQIVERHRGRFRVRSSQRTGRSGSVITLFLPFDAAVL